MKMSLWSLSCQQSVFKRYHSSKHFWKVLPIRWQRKPAGIEITSPSTYVFTNFKIVFTHRLINKPFLIWLLKTSPHFKYVATLLCNLSLITCFAGINVLQGSVATYARCGWIFNIHWTTNLPSNLLVNFFLKSVKIWRKFGHESLTLLF